MSGISAVLIAEGNLSDNMPLEIADGISAHTGGDGSLSISQGKNVIFMKTKEVSKFKQWLNEVLIL